MADQPEQAVEETAQEVGTAEYRLSVPSYTDVPSVYSNFVQATVAQHDLTLFFSWYATPPLGEKPPTEPVDVPVRALTAVSVPLGILRPLIRILESQASTWEQAMGQQLPADQRAADKENGE